MSFFSEVSEFSIQKLSQKPCHIINILMSNNPYFSISIFHVLVLVNLFLFSVTTYSNDKPSTILVLKLTDRPHYHQMPSSCMQGLNQGLLGLCRTTLSIEVRLVGLQSSLVFSHFYTISCTLMVSQACYNPALKIKTTFKSQCTYCTTLTS